ncbi:hypothetical protein [Jannaschia pohangensis]|nr:hypothetical protein [Jannaschia pohangensis]
MLTSAAVPALAQQTSEIRSGHRTHTLPVPDGHFVKARDSGQPPHVLVIETARVEPWEQASEVYQEILAVAMQTDFTDPADLDARASALFDLSVDAAGASRDGRDIRLTDALVLRPVFHFLLTRSGAEVAQSVDVTANAAGTRGVIMSTAFVMPDVTTSPILTEVSFVSVGSDLIIFIAQRVNVDSGVELGLRRVGAVLRERTGR